MSNENAKKETERFVSLLSEDLIRNDPHAAHAFRAVRDGMATEQALAEALKAVIRSKIEMQIQHHGQLMAMSEQNSIEDFGSEVDVKGLMVDLEKAADALRQAEIQLRGQSYAAEGSANACKEVERGIREHLERYNGGKQ